MSAPDNFKFATIPAPSSPDERRFVELVRLVVREELRKVVAEERAPYPDPHPFMSGCICPPSSEKTCEGYGCPRKPMNLVGASA